MTDLSLPALREAVAKMTPGPWLDNGTEATDEDCQEVILEAPPRYDGEDFDVPVDGDMDRRRADIAGIVALRNAAPALLDELEALKARTCKTCRYVMPDWSSAPTHGTCGVSGLFCQTHGFTCGAWQQKDEGHP